MKIGAILDQIDLSSIVLPKFQRGYVWNREQVRSLMHSLYRKFPVGSLLVWITKTENANIHGENAEAYGAVRLLLDGQQRITSLYGIIRGEPPRFFDEPEKVDTFTGLYFNLGEERFEFYAPVKMKDDPLWIDVTELMQTGTGKFIPRLLAIQDLQPNIETYINRLASINNIKETDLHIEEVTGEDKTVDIVVDIFNRVNSSGTKLSKGDLALAKICAEWPDARSEMKNRLDKWKSWGFNFRLEWFLRCINTILTGEALFSALKGIDTSTFGEGVGQAEVIIDKLLDLISARLGLDHDRVLGSRYSFPVLTRYLTQCGGSWSDHKESDKLLYWYIHTFLWGRYAGSTETVLNQDLALIEEPEGGLDRLISQLRKDRPDLGVRPDDFLGWSRGARFYPLLYMLTRICRSSDWGSGIELSKYLLGRNAKLEVHHIFPKKKLYENRNGYDRTEVNAIANLTFLTKETNIYVSDREPSDYLEEFLEKNPGSIESHWIPIDRNLWKMENYLDFLAARREILAKAANEFLNSLFTGEVPEERITAPIPERPEMAVPGGVESVEEEKIIEECNEWVKRQGLSEGEILYELTDEETGESLAVIDLAWPDGLQEQLSQPVALLIDEGKETEEAINGAGYRYFTDVNAFRTYVQREILAHELDT